VVFSGSALHLLLMRVPFRQFQLERPPGSCEDELEKAGTIAESFVISSSDKVRSPEYRQVVF
jgi:hypothetical protein